MPGWNASSSHPLFSYPFYWNFSKSSMKIEGNQKWMNEWMNVDSKLILILSKESLTKLLMWMFAVRTYVEREKGQNREFCKQKSNEIASVNFRRRKSKKKKLSSSIRDHYLLYGFSHVSTFSSLATAPSSFDSNSIPKSESSQTFLSPTLKIKERIRKSFSIGNWIKAGTLGLMYVYKLFFFLFNSGQGENNIFFPS